MTRYRKLIRQTKRDLLAIAVVMAAYLLLPSATVSNMIIAAQVLLLACLSGLSAYLALCVSQYPRGRMLCLWFAALAVASIGLAAYGVHWRFFH